MKGKCVLTVCGLALAVLGAGIMTAQDEKGKRVDREADKRAIEKLAREGVQAFNDRDAAALVANWTAEGEYIRNDGESVRGRAAIEKGYADFFKSIKGKPKLEIQLDGLRFTSTDTALSEVTLRLKNEDGDVVGSSWRNTLLVRESGKWKVAIVNEWDRDNALDVSLKELGWLIGDWHVATKEREVTTTYAWDKDKVFIKGKYVVKEGAKVVESGTQTIGRDHWAGGIRSWVFQSDGGYGEGQWSRDGKKWTVSVYGVTPEGRELTATAIYVHLDADTYTWQSVDQAVDGTPLPDTKPIKINKRKSK